MAILYERGCFAGGMLEALLSPFERPNTRYDEVSNRRIEDYLHVWRENSHGQI